MRFIERLKQQNEAAAQIGREQTAELQRKREAEETARQQKEAQEREFHAQQRHQAEAFREESGFTTTVNELKKELPGVKYIHGDTFRQSDSDSVVDDVEWDQTKVGEGENKMGRWDKLEGKHIAIETCPDGTFVFHGGWGGGSAVSLERWRENKEVLEIALEKAYKHPRIEAFSGNFTQSLYAKGHTLT